MKRVPKMHPRRYSKEILQFVAKDEDGKEYIIVETREFIDTTDQHGKTTTTPLAGKFATIDGRGVDRVARGHYELLGIFQTVDSLKSGLSV